MGLFYGLAANGADGLHVRGRCQVRGERGEQRSDLRRGRQAFEEEKLSVWQQFMGEKQREVEKIREDRRRGEEETAIQLRQVQADVEEARRRINEERARLEQHLERAQSTLEQVRSSATQHSETLRNLASGIQQQVAAATTAPTIPTSLSAALSTAKALLNRFHST